MRIDGSNVYVSGFGEDSQYVYYIRVGLDKYTDAFYFVFTFPEVYLCYCLSNLLLPMLLS